MEMKLQDIKQIGKGAFAKVFLVQDLLTGKYYAKKVVETSKMDQKELNLFAIEKLILRTSLTYNFKNIIKLHRVEKLNNGDYNLILDYCNGGSLHECLYNYINKYRKPFPENIVRYLMEQILIGVECLHKFGIIHRDLKLGNILINYNNEYDRINNNILASEIKIIDFNVSYFPNNSEPKTFLGTIPNMAPSVINNCLPNTQAKEYDEKIDIWSLGTICYEMLFGQPLFGSMQNNENFNNILNANFNIPNTISPQARSFLYCMLSKDGINRLSCTQLLNHEFIKGNIKQTLNYNNITINNQDLNKGGNLQIKGQIPFQTINQISQINNQNNPPKNKFEQYPLVEFSSKPFFNISGYASNSYNGKVKSFNESQIKIILNVEKKFIPACSYPNTQIKEYKTLISYFGIFDGHGGEKCAKFLKNNLDGILFQRTMFPNNVIESVRETFETVENNFRQQAVQNGKLVDKSGSCALISLIVNNMLYAINLGDSRALYSRDGGKEYYQITRDHKPNDPKERARIENAGGQVYYANKTVINGVEVTLKEEQFGPGFKFPYRFAPSGLSVSL